MEAHSEEAKSFSVPLRSVTHQHILASVVTELGRRLPSTPTGGVRLLEAGCGDGYLVAYLESRLRASHPSAVEVHGFEVTDSRTEPRDFPGLVVARMREWDPSVRWDERFRALSVRDPWPQEDESIDVVVSNQVLEHVADLPAFLAQLHRVLRPGGFSVHVFPLRRQLFEFHLSMPLVHQIDDYRIRSWLIRAWTRVGWGTFRQFEQLEGIDADFYAETRSDFIQFGTYYRSWREISWMAKSAGLRTSHGYTRGLYHQKLRQLVRRPFLEAYSAAPSPTADAISFILFPLVGTVTLVIDKPESVESWRFPGAHS